MSDLTITDCHHHVYDYEFQKPDPAVTRLPPRATLADWRAMARPLGIARHVLVQPSTFGFDNSLHLAATEEAGAAARCVVVVRPDTPMAELRAMHARGARGVRVNLLYANALTPADLPAIGRLCAELGWHVQHAGMPETLLETAAALRALPCPVVIDHFAHIHAAGFESHPAWDVLHGLLEAGNTWVKLSSPYSLADDPLSDEITAFARRILAIAPERAVWGTNSPHPNATAPQDEAALLRVVDRWAPEAATRRRLLADNAAVLYGF